MFFDLFKPFNAIITLVIFGCLAWNGMLGPWNLADDYENYKSQIFNGYAAADRKPSFFIGKYDEKQYEWKFFCRGSDNSYTCYYDNASVSLDDRNGIATVLIKKEQGKEIELNRLIIRFDGDNTELLVTDTWSNTKETVINHKISKKGKNTIYDFLCQRINKDLEVRYSDKTSHSLEEYLENYGSEEQVRFPKEPISTISNRSKVRLKGGLVELLDYSGELIRKVYVFNEGNELHRVQLLDERRDVGDRSFAVARKNFNAALPGSTRERPQTIAIHKGEKFPVAKNISFMYYLKAKDSQGKEVIVPAHINDLIVDREKRFLKVRFTYKKQAYEGWVEDSVLTLVK